MKQLFLVEFLENGSTGTVLMWTTLTERELKSHAGDSVCVITGILRLCPDRWAKDLLDPRDPLGVCDGRGKHR